MRILITGGTGYLGRNIVNEIIKNHTAVLLVRKDSKSKNLKEFENNANIEIFGVSDEEIELAVKSGIDCIIHLATLYGRNGEQLNEILDANYIFPLKILKNAIKYDVKYFFNMDTAINKFVNEYSMTKKQFRDWGQYYASQEKIRFINMKAEHFYGPNDDKVKFIANMIEKMKNNVQYIDTTLGEQERAFIYIDDLIEGFFCILNYEIQKKEMEFTEYELGPNANIKIKDVLKIIKKLTCSTSEIRFGAIPYRKNEEMKSSCDNSKLKSIGWKQKTESFEVGINKILDKEGFTNERK